MCNVDDTVVIEYWMDYYDDMYDISATEFYNYYMGADAFDWEAYHNQPIDWPQYY